MATRSSGFPQESDQARGGLSRTGGWGCSDHLLLPLPPPGVPIPREWLTGKLGQSCGEGAGKARTSVPGGGRLALLASAQEGAFPPRGRVSGEDAECLLRDRVSPLELPPLARLSGCLGLANADLGLAKSFCVIAPLAFFIFLQGIAMRSRGLLPSESHLCIWQDLIPVQPRGPALQSWRQPEMAYQSTLETPKGATEGSTLREDAELRLILVGKTGGGKSATGNTILGWREFESTLGAMTTTLKCQRGQGSWHGMKVSVVDTPAIFDSEDCNEIVRREVMSCIELSWPGPHALVLVTQVGRFTAEDAAAAKHVQDIFGAESARHTIVLFTCKEDLGGDPLQEYVRESDNKALRALIQQYGNRFCGFNNKAEGAEREEQVSELMEKVEQIISERGGSCYTNQLYLEPNLRDEDVRVFINRNKTARRKAEGGWKQNQILLGGGFLAVTFLLIIIVIRFS